MTHRSITNACEALGMTVRQDPCNGRKLFSATFPEPKPPSPPNLTRVYWTTTLDTGALLGLPRVMTKAGQDTHARTVKEIQYLVRRETP